MNKSDIYSEITNRIVTDLESGCAPWAKPWRNGVGGMSMPRNHVTSRAYSGVNVLILWNALADGRYSVNRWLTFKQAMDLGGHVRKGEKGTAIVYAGNFVPEQERARADRDGNDERAVYFLKRMTVFNVEQCEGIAAPIATPVNDDRDRVEMAEALCAASGVRVQHGGNRAFYSPSLDYVQMPQFAAFPDRLDYYRVLCHELIHSTGHDSRLSRKFADRFGSKDYAREELVAEIGAAIVCAGLGIPYITRHADYVGSWLSVLREDKRAIFKAASMASKAAQWLEAQSVTSIEDARELAFA